MKIRIGRKAQDFTHTPIRCKLFNHVYEERYIDPLLDNPNVGMLICKRKYCGHIYMVWEDWK